MKKLAVLTATAMLVVSIFSGCSGQNDVTQASETQTNVSQASETQADTPKTITFWHTWGAANHPNKPLIDYAVDKVEKKYGVKVEQDSMEFEAYKMKLSTALAADEGPDIIRGWSLGYMKPLVEGQKLLALNDYLTDDFKGKMLKGATDNMTFDGVTYGLPVCTIAYGLYVNKPLFDKAGLELPDTWDKLITAVKHFRSQGVTPMALGGKTLTTTSLYYDAIELRAVGTDKFTNTLKKNSDYSDPAFMTAVSKFRELVDLGAFSDAAVGMSRDECEIDVFNGKTPMYFSGNWVAAQYYMDSSSVNPDDIVIMPMPAWDGAAADNNQITGAIGDAFYANASTKYPEFMANVLQDMCFGISEGYYKFGNGIPTYKVEGITAPDMPLFVKFNEYVQSAESITTTPEFEYSGDDLQQYYQYLQELLINKLSPEQFIENMNKISAKK